MHIGSTNFLEYAKNFPLAHLPKVSPRVRNVSLISAVALTANIVMSGTPALADTQLPTTSYQTHIANAQTLQVSDALAPQTVTRDGVTVTEAPKAVTPAKTRPAPNAAVVGEAQAYARTQVANEEEWNCLYNLWARESGWRVEAYNTSSGATGIPQALPGSKMSSAGADWETNPITQITWGLGYVNGRYGSPCGAWAHSENVGWY